VRYRVTSLFDYAVKKTRVKKHLHSTFFYTRESSPWGVDEWLFILPSEWRCFRNERNIRLICAGKVPNRICSTYHPRLFDSVGELRASDYNGFWSNCFLPPLFRLLLSDALFRWVNGVVSFDIKKKKTHTHTNTSFRIKNSILTESMLNENNVTKIYSKLNFA
jgi:hypothetical protein